MTELQKLALGTLPTICKVPPKKEQEEAFLAQPIMIKGATFSSNDATGETEAKQDILSNWINYYYRQRNVHMKYQSPNIYTKDDGDDGDETERKPYGPPLPPTEEEKQKMLEEYQEKKGAIIEQIRSKQLVKSCPYSITLHDVYPLDYNPNSTDPVQVWVEGNTVKVKCFLGFYDNVELTLETDGFLGLGKEKIKLHHLFYQGVQDYWTTLIKGSEYDFWPEFSGNIETTVLVKNYSVDKDIMRDEQNFVKVYLHGYDPPPSPSYATSYYFDENGNRIYEWKISGEKEIHMQTRYPGDEKLYSADYYKRVVAHEMGHIFGIKDAYFAFILSDNSERYLGGNDEVTKDNKKWDLSVTGDIMLNNGFVSPNDVEMLLHAFYENECQGFWDAQTKRYGVEYPEQKRSDAIKLNPNWLDK